MRIKVSLEICVDDIVRVRVRTRDRVRIRVRVRVGG